MEVYCRMVQVHLGFPQNIQAHFEAWRAPINFPRGKAMWRASFLALVWIVWKERNARCFEGRSSKEQVLEEKLKFTVASWMKVLPLFKAFHWIS